MTNQVLNNSRFRQSSSDILYRLIDKWTGKVHEQMNVYEQ